MAAFLSKLAGLASGAGSKLIAGPLGWIVNLLFSFLYNKLIEWVKRVQKDKANTAEAAKRAEDDMKKADALTDKSTKQEQRDAADDAFKHF